MCPRPANIDIKGTDFPSRLIRERERRQLTKSELAEQAGVSYRTIHDLESGRRDRIQEKTLLLLAGALGVPPADLFEPQAPSEIGRRPPRRTSWAPLAVLAILIVAGFAVGWFTGLAGSRWTIEEGVLVARHSLLGHEIWRHGGAGKVRFCRVSPWSTRVLLVGTKEADAAASPLLAVDRLRGRVLWSVAPDRDRLVEAFGPAIMNSGSMYPAWLAVADLHGEGRPVVVVNFRHDPFYPTALCAIDRDGRLLAQYGSKGYIYDLLVADLDGDGKDEVVAVGTNNDPAYQAATAILLDDRHFGGATLDAAVTPSSSVPDSARIRLLLPKYPAPYMKLLDLDRLNASQPRLFARGEGRLGIGVMVGGSRDSDIIVFMDEELRPLRAEATDALAIRMRRSFPDSLQGAGPADPAWLERWLATHVRFEAGHWPPPGVPGELDVTTRPVE